uniref:Ribosomal protein S13 n=1 Tax=Imasa heleensis TaxID=2772037 RepID=A0A893DCW3_9EUKA|nr:ribosomal protein S13 [Imasa heleensis]QRR29736.1 ribosomal protein S13 [Imasa heleensis]
MYILNTHVRSNHIVKQALSSILGISTYTSNCICAKFHIGKGYPISEISLRSINSLISYINNRYLINNKLLKYYYVNLKRYIELKNYRGLRHRMGYPVRGQRTRTNGRSQRKLYKRIYLYNYK